jgi:hypothetical protein
LWKTFPQIPNTDTEKYRIPTRKNTVLRHVFPGWALFKKLFYIGCFQKSGFQKIPFTDTEKYRLPTRSLFPEAFYIGVSRENRPIHKYILYIYIYSYDNLYDVLWKCGKPAFRL